MAPRLNIWEEPFRMEIRTIAFLVIKALYMKEGGKNERKEETSVLPNLYNCVG